MMHVDQPSFSRNHIIWLLLPVSSISHNCENVTTVMLVFRHGMEEQNLQHDHKTNVAATLKPSDSLKREQWSLTEHLLENSLNLI